MEKEFGVGDKIKQVMREGKEGKEVIIIELEDWQTKEKIMREKSKLRGRNIFIDHDMTKKEREVQRKIEKEKGQERRGKKIKE